MIATTATGEWLKLCTGWQMSSVNTASELCTTTPSVSGIPPSSTASATIAAAAWPGRLIFVAGLKTAPLLI
jgi:hypothetical protein